MRSSGVKLNKDDLYLWADWATEAYMFIRYSRYTQSLIKENQSLRKYYVIDNGLRRAVLLPQSTDDGKLLENLVALELYRRREANERIFYWQGNYECDFVVQRGEEISELVQVTWEMTDPNTRQREITDLLEAAKATGCKNLTIVTRNEEDAIDVEGFKVKIIKLKDWLLNK